MEIKGISRQASGISRQASAFSWQKGDMETVKVRECSGWNTSPIAALFGKGPKLTLTCGKCGFIWQKRPIYNVDNPRMICPACNTVNLIPLVWSCQLKAES